MSSRDPVTVTDQGPNGFAVLDTARNSRALRVVKSLPAPPRKLEHGMQVDAPLDRAIGRKDGHGRAGDFDELRRRRGKLGVERLDQLVVAVEGVVVAKAQAGDQRGRLDRLRSRVTMMGSISEHLLPNGAGSFAQPLGMAKGPDGNVWFTDFMQQVGRVNVRVWDQALGPAPMPQRQAAPPGTGSSPTWHQRQ